MYKGHERANNDTLAIEDCGQENQSLHFFYLLLAREFEFDWFEFYHDLSWLQPFFILINILATNSLQPSYYF